MKTHVPSIARLPSAARSPSIARSPNIARSPTILDVARRAGVSKSTVSNVIRDADCVAPPMRARVQEAISPLDYRPNAAGTTVGAAAHHDVWRGGRRPGQSVPCRNGKTDRTACGSPGLSHDVRQHPGRRSRGGRTGKPVAISCGRHPVPGPRRDHKARARDLVAGKVPAVFVTCSTDWGDVVCGDDRRGAEEATRHLLALGHRRIAYFADPIVEDAADRARQIGYRAVMADAGLTPAVFRWRRSPSRLFRNDREVTPEDVLRGKKRMTAVFSSNDLGAIEVLDCADRLGIRVPEDLSVVGFDDVVMARLARINLHDGRAAAGRPGTARDRYDDGTLAGRPARPTGAAHRRPAADRSRLDRAARP